jgi:hypothetical protein
MFFFFFFFFKRFGHAYTYSSEPVQSSMVVLIPHAQKGQDSLVELFSVKPSASTAIAAILDVFHLPRDIQVNTLPWTSS